MTDFIQPVLICVDTRANQYSRYGRGPGGRAKFLRRWQADRPLTQWEVETLRNCPAELDAPETPQSA